MIQVDIFFTDETLPDRRHCITSIPINRQLLTSKYGAEICCKLENFKIIKVETQEQILLKFAEIYKEYKPEFDLGFNTEGYN